MAYVSNKTMSLDEYIEEKLRMLKKDFHMKLTKSEIEHMKGLKNDIQVDNYARDLFRKKYK